MSKLTGSKGDICNGNVSGMTQDLNETQTPSSSLTSLQLSRKRRRQAKLREQARGFYGNTPDIPPLAFDFSHRMLPIEDSDIMDPGSSSCRNNVVESLSKRREANARERLRVRNLNSGFAKLRRILPTVPPNRKPSKVDTLQGAIDYIHQLEHLLEATGGIPDIECMAANGHSHSRQSVTECPFVFDLEDRLKVPITHKRFHVNRRCTKPKTKSTENYSNPCHFSSQEQSLPAGYSCKFSESYSSDFGRQHSPQGSNNILSSEQYTIYNPESCSMWMTYPEKEGSRLSGTEENYLAPEAHQETVVDLSTTGSSLESISPKHTMANISNAPYLRTVYAINSNESCSINA
ncbi:uncharacterized protein LOC143461276 [Clavelina lepadiformis]|uniref:uncharacterized protein LOC143461276 n=1 Tax=Clavelina lepadiformis TaxID=159417 RepID=UPI004042C2A7